MFTIYVYNLCTAYVYNILYVQYVHVCVSRLCTCAGGRCSVTPRSIPSASWLLSSVYTMNSLCGELNIMALIQSLPNKTICT